MTIEIVACSYGKPATDGKELFQHVSRHQNEEFRPISRWFGIQMKASNINASSGDCRRALGMLAGILG